MSRGVAVFQEVPPGVALLAYAMLFGAYLVFWPDQAQSHQTAVALGLVAAPALAARLCWRASTWMLPGREQWSARLLALSCLAWMLAQSARLLPAWIPAQGTAFLPEPILRLGASPSLVFVAAWALYHVLASTAFLLPLPSRAGVHTRLSSAMDAMLLTAGITALGWQVLLTPVLEGGAGDPTGRLDVISSLGALFLTLTPVSMAICMSKGAVSRRYLYLLVAFVAQIIVNALYVWLMYHGGYQRGHPIDALWPLVFALFVLAATSPSPARPAGATAVPPAARNDGSWMSRARMYLPYLAMPAAGLLLYLEFGEGRPRHPTSTVLVVAFTMSVACLVLFRQFLSLLENNSLNRSLAALSRQLESRVVERTQDLAERTAQLAVLNRVATRLSHCITPQEVLSTGLALAGESTRLPAGVVWLLGPDDRLEMAVGRGLPDHTLSWLATLPPRTSSDLRKVLASGRPLLPKRAAAAALASPLATPSDADACVLSVPLLSRGATLGAMVLFGGEEFRCGDEELQLAQGIGAAIGVALENARRYEEARELAERDPVTGLLNHRAFHQRLEQEVQRRQSTGQKLSVVMMDVDRFKLLNDTYGHLAGDQVLRQIATVLSASVRGSDLVARYAGDEFVALLLNAGAEQAIVVAERFRAALAAHPYRPPDREVVPIWMSFGIAAYPQDAVQAHELLAFADVNLYRAKRQGGDKITTGTLPGREKSTKSTAFGVLEGLVTAVDNKDQYTRKHSEDVTRYALQIARALGLSQESQRTLRIAGLLHDVGKLGVPDHILHKPGRLTDEEYTILKQHAILGEMIIKGVPKLQDVLSAVGAHHERFDGQGYPRGLEGKEIPLMGRILAVADAYSAMTTDRPYRRALQPAEAKSELLRVAGTQLDPELVRAFIGCSTHHSPAAEDVPVQAKALPVPAGQHAAA